MNAIQIEMEQVAQLCPACSKIILGCMVTGNSVNKTSPALSVMIDGLLLAKKEAGRSQRYMQRLRQYLCVFARGREHLPIGQITIFDLEQWFRIRAEKPATQKSAMGLLSALFTFAWKRGHITENPVFKMEKPHLVRTMPTFFTVEQCQFALTWTATNRPRYLAWLALAMFAGLRPESEADRMTWENIDLDKARVYVDADKCKTHRKRIVDLTLCPPAVHWLRYAKEIGSDFQFNNKNRNRYLRPLRNAMGLTVWPQDVLRHSCASYLYAHHQDAGKIAAFLGNSASILMHHYRALVEKEDADKFFAIMPPVPPK